MMTQRVASMRAILAAAILAAPASLLAEKIWVEGEKPAQSTMVRHPWWYERVQRTELSGGDFIANFDKDVAGVAEYEVTAAAAGEYTISLRANPVQATMSLRVNDGEWTKLDPTRRITEQENIADDGNPDLRFMAWIDAGKVALKAGKNTIAFRAESERYHHGAIDCFVVANEPFVPMGILRPEQMVLLEEKMRDAPTRAGSHSPPRAITSRPARRSTFARSTRSSPVNTASSPPKASSSSSAAPASPSASGASTARRSSSPNRR